MTEFDEMVQVPGRGWVTPAEVRKEAEKAVAKGRAFGLDVEMATRVLISGETLPHYCAFKNVATANDFAEARQRLADWEENERKRKAAEQGWPEGEGK